MLRACFRFVSSFVFLLISGIAHADFNKALEAYIKNDAESMLSEITDSINNKSTDGLMLLINSISYDGKRLQPFISTYDSDPGGNNFLLDQDRTQNLFKLLEAATETNQYANFRLLFKRYINDPASRRAAFKKMAQLGLADAALALYFEIVQDNNYDIKSSEGPFWLKRAAELGSPYAAYLISKQYLDDPEFGARLSSEFPTSKEFGLKWAKIALSNSDPLNDPFRSAVVEISQLYSHGIGIKESEAAEEAFRLNLVACFSVTKMYFHSPEDCLIQKYSNLKMYMSHQIDAESLKRSGEHAFWCDKTCNESTDVLLPNGWRNKTKLDLPQTLKKETGDKFVKPVFSFRKLIGRDYASDFLYRLDFYANGRVTLLRDPIVPDEVPKESSWNLSSSAIKGLITEIHKLGFGDWKLVNHSESHSGKSEIYSLMLRNGNSIKTVHFYENPDAFGKDATINQVILAIEKLVPIYAYANSQMKPSRKMSTKSRELEVYNLNLKGDLK